MKASDCVLVMNDVQVGAAMAGKVAECKAVLREKLVALAEVRVAEEDLRGLKARDLAREAGYALGAV